MALGWYGITPASRLFMIWGHSHLLGTGARKWLNGRLRMVKDNLLGYYRFSAYDLQEQLLRRAAEELIRFRPEYVFGYSVALDSLAGANAHLRERLRGLGVRVVIVTAEAFPAPDSEALLRDLFGCQVAMEYGSVETDAVAHTHPDSDYRVFWRNYLVEGEREALFSAMKIRITSLYPRCFPLVRYEIGDEIEPCQEEGEEDAQQVPGIARFKRVIGRCNAYVVLTDGARIHSEAFSHVLRGYAVIDSFQVVQRGAEINLLIRSQEPLSVNAEHSIRTTLCKVHPELERVRIQRVEQLNHTIAGKTPMVIYSEA
jgi:phenylacetate-coenzyme A ligase PaaK-like adenylate-forming protein